MGERDGEGFVPIRDYAVLSDMRSTALVALDGSVDWWAAPDLDDPPVCAAVLSPKSGGAVKLAPLQYSQVSRSYRPGTLVLETDYTTPSGRVRVSDALDLGAVGLAPWAELARVVTVETGEVPMRWEVSPGDGLQGLQPWAFTSRGLPMAMCSSDRYLTVVADDLGTPRAEGRSVRGEFTARPGRPYVLAVTCTAGAPAWPPATERVLERAQRTATHWQEWSAQVGYDGPWREAVVRSALVIKALTFQATGGIAAAATTSLPEVIGGRKNFDYRFAWVRDAAFALDVMGRLGLDEELHAGVTWLLGAVSKDAPDMGVLYSVRAKRMAPDMQEAGAPGYRCSAPVNRGNKAAGQTQLGAYGDLMDAVWRYTQSGGRLTGPCQDVLCKLVDRVCRSWQRPDSGLWELSEQRHYTSSKIGCWTALDRAVRLAEEGQLACVEVERWRGERAAVQEWARRHCWSAAKRSFTFYAGTEDLDAAVLLAAHTGFCASDDPMLVSTVEAVRSELSAGGPLLYRYLASRGQEGAFVACSFWLVEALAHLGRAQEAEEVFSALVGKGNDVGLFSEQMAPGTEEMLGNMPQALSHLALLGAATSLSK